MKGIQSQTHIIRRQTLKVGHCKRISKAQVQPWTDMTILNNPGQKRKRNGRQEYSLQELQCTSEYNLQEYSVQVNTVCKEKKRVRR